MAWIKVKDKKGFERERIKKTRKTLYCTNALIENTFWYGRERVLYAHWLWIQ